MPLSEDWLIPKVKIPAVEIPVEYPVANAVQMLWQERPISSGLVGKLEL